MSGTVKKKLTGKKAVALLEEVAAGREDYIYDQSYVNRVGTAPGCIVGHVLHRLGMTPNELKALDRIGVITDIPDDLLPARLTPRARGVLRIAQRRQDDGCSWGNAAAAAKNALR